MELFFLIVLLDDAVDVADGVVVVTVVSLLNRDNNAIEL